MSRSDWLLDIDSESVVVSFIPADKHWYARKEHALKGGYDIEELADDPDFDVRIDMDWSDFKEQDNG